MQEINTETSICSVTPTFDYLSASEQISFQSAMQQIKERLQILREEEEEANKNLKEVETTLSDFEQELKQLSPDLEKLGRDVFDDSELSLLLDFQIRSVLDRVSATRGKLSEIEAAKIKRQEESKKGFWGKIKSVVGDVLEYAASVLSSDPSVIMLAKGVNGQLELLEDRIRIKREGIRAFLGHGFKGDKEIRIEHISAIQFKNAGNLFNGYIQFSFLGSHEAKGGLFDATKDENTIVFYSHQQERFEKIKKAIEQRINDNRGVSCYAA